MSDMASARRELRKSGAILVLRVDRSEKQSIERLAAKHGVTISDYVRRRLGLSVECVPPEEITNRRKYGTQTKAAARRAMRRKFDTLDDRLSLSAIAEWAGVSRDSIKEAVLRGEVRFERDARNAVMVRREDVRDWLATVASQ